MKRNNIFMFSYIVFIFLAASIKMIYDYPMWSRVVVAITAASWMFAISDCCASLYAFQKNIYETFFPLLDKIKYNIEQVKTILVKKSYNEEITKVEFCEKDHKSLIASVTRSKKIAKSLEILSLVLTFLGFLVFMCVLCFEQVYLFFFLRQDVSTVLSFGMILLAQFFNDYGKMRVSHQKSNLEKMIYDWNALLNSYNLDLEEKTNAD